MIVRTDDRRDMCASELTDYTLVTAMTDRQLSPGARVAIGLAFIVGGTGIVIFSAWVLRSQLETKDADPLAAIAGGVFLALVGALFVVPVRFARWRAVLGAACFTSIAWVFDWIAFGPGERQFSGGFSVGGLGISGNPGETFGRIVFGIVAALMDLAAVCMWVVCLRVLLAQFGKPDQNTTH